MNGLEVDKVGKFIEEHVANVRYLGCHMVDDCHKLYPGGIGGTSFGIINVLPSYSDPSDMGHYILLAHKGNRLLCFDSYGLSVRDYSPYLASYIDKCKGTGYKVIEVRKRLQGSASLVCGLYCLYIGYIIAIHGLTGVYKIIRRRFSNTFSKNDRTVVSLCYSIFPLPGCVRTFCTQSNYMSFERCRTLLCGVSRRGWS